MKRVVEFIKLYLPFIKLYFLIIKNMPANKFNIHGLTDEQVIIAMEKYGQNKLKYKIPKSYYLTPYYNTPPL